MVGADTMLSLSFKDTKTNDKGGAAVQDGNNE